MKNLRKQLKRGDIQQACTRAGVTRRVLETALKKEDLSLLTCGELRVVVALRRVINERSEMLAEFQS